MMKNKPHLKKTPSRRPLLSLLLLSVLFIIGLYAIYSLRPDTPEQKEESMAQRVDAPLPMHADLPPIRGVVEALVLIEEFSDFQCPFCARSVPVLKRLLKEYPGKIRWVFRHFPVVASHPNAPLIHLAALAAGRQGRFWEMHDIVFEKRDRVALEDLFTYARDLGLDMKAFETSLRDRSLLARIQADYDEGINRLVRATPTFFVNGRKVEGAIPYELFKREVELALARAQSTDPTP